MTEGGERKGARREEPEGKIDGGVGAMVVEQNPALWRIHLESITCLLFVAA